MKRFIYMLAAFALMGAVSCQPDEEVAVHASFTTDKESYDVGDPVVLTNTSTAENALIAICKWELGKGVVSYETTPENISYDQAGEYVIKLTVTSDRGAKKSSFEKTIRVVDNIIRPVADFTWSPEKVVAGEPVQFTDRSTDEDGEVVAWEWKFGTTTSDKQNPEFTFAAQGATEVSLTVTDNKKGRNTKTVTIDVGRGAISLDLLWSYPYDDTKDAYVFGTADETWWYRPVAFIEADYSAEAIARDQEEFGIDPAQSCIRPATCPQEYAHMVHDYLNGCMSKLHHPKHILVMDEFPRTIAGKVDRRALKQRYDKRIDIKSLTLYRAKQPFSHPVKTAKGNVDFRESFFVDV